MLPEIKTIHQTKKSSINFKRIRNEMKPTEFNGCNTMSQCQESFEIEQSEIVCIRIGSVAFMQNYNCSS